MVLDIGAQYDQLEKNEQFRFTPPTHVMLGLKECILEYVDEGGMRGRAARWVKLVAMSSFILKKINGYC